MERGAVGAVSGLASAWPDVVAALVHEHSPEAHLRVTELRANMTMTEASAGVWMQERIDVLG
mgnify:CR=1 FL=1